MIIGHSKKICNSNKLENIKEMDIFLDTYDPSK